MLHELHRFWRERGCADEYIGTLVNAWLAQGGEAWGVCAGAHYVDVGTLHGYRQAVHLLGGADPVPSAMPQGAGRSGAAKWQEA